MRQILLHKAFDILLIIVIIISVVLVALETVGWINEKYYNILNIRVDDNNIIYC